MKEVKAVFIGPAQVGKTAILNKLAFLEDYSGEDYKKTIGAVSYLISTQNSSNEEKKITAWELGSGQLNDASKSRLRGTQILVCCFDLSKNIDKQATFFRDLIEPNLITEEPEIILVGTKYDLIEPEQNADNLLKEMKNALKEKVTDPLFQKALTKEIETFSVNSFTNENLGPLYKSLFETSFGAYDNFVKTKKAFIYKQKSTCFFYETEAEAFVNALDKIAKQHRSEFHEHCQSLLQATQEWLNEPQNENKRTNLKTKYQWIRQNASCHLSWQGQLLKALGNLLRKVERSEFLCRKGKACKLYAYKHYAFFKTDNNKQTPEQTELLHSMYDLKHKLRSRQYNIL